MKHFDIMRGTTVLTQLVLVMFLTVTLSYAQIGETRTVGDNERTPAGMQRRQEGHPHRHQRDRTLQRQNGGNPRSHSRTVIGPGGLSVPYRDYTEGEPNEDPTGMATTRVIARVPNLDLSAPDRTEGHSTGRSNGGTRLEEDERSLDRSSEHQEGSGITDHMNTANTTANCTHCVVREELKKLRIEAIKSQILSKLRLKSAPNVTAKRLPSIPIIQRIMEQYEMQRDSPHLSESYYGGGGEPDDYHAKTMKVVNFATPIIKNNNTSSKKLRFEFSFDVLDSTVTRAEFYVYIRPVMQPINPDAMTLILIHNILPHKKSKKKNHNHNNNNSQEHVERTKVLHARKISLATGTGQWYHFDITKQVQIWIRNPRKNLGLKIEANDLDGNPLAIIVPTDANEELYKPFVEVSVEEYNSGRRKREMKGLQCKENDMEKHCCRYPLVVDFEEFKWDWIIAPKNYHANFCSGECPFVFLQKYPHTHIVQQSNPLGSAGPCCTGTKLSPISMLYFDSHNNIILGKLPGMTVDRCGCS